MEQDLATHPEGHHIIAELSQCKNIIQYNDDKALKELLRISIEAAGMTPVEITTHNFRESGISGIGILIESHMSAHFWPAIGLIEFDCYTCGPGVPEKGLERFIQAVQPKYASLTKIRRGVTSTKENNVYYHAIEKKKSQQ